MNCAYSVINNMILRLNTKKITLFPFCCLRLPRFLNPWKSYFEVPAESLAEDSAFILQGTESSARDSAKTTNRLFYKQSRSDAPVDDEKATK